MYVLGVIPARGGSKRIRRKNLAPLAGRPLLAWTCEAARGSHRLAHTILSTDDEAIAACARECGVEVPFIRPADLALDATPTLPVIQHAVTLVEAEGSPRVDAVVILQPTSPLRRSFHIDAAVDLLEETGADSVVSVVEVPHQFNPTSVLCIEDGRLVPFATDPANAILRRQDKPRAYARNGAAVYAARREVLFAGSLFGDDCRPLVMDTASSVDIDDLLDLRWAEFLLSQGETDWQSVRAGAPSKGGSAES